MNNLTYIASDCEDINNGVILLFPSAVLVSICFRVPVTDGAAEEEFVIFLFSGSADISGFLDFRSGSGEDFFTLRISGSSIIAKYCLFNFPYNRS